MKHVLPIAVLLLVLAPGLPARENAPAPQEQEFVLKIYDIKDFLKTPEGASGQNPGQEAAAREAQSARLAEVIRTFMVPPLDGEREEVKMLAPGTLMARAAQEKQEWIRFFLEHQRSAGMIFISVEWKILHVPPAVFDAWNPSREHRVLQEREEAEALAKTWLEHKDVRLINAPRLLVPNRERGTIKVMNQVHYIEGYRVYENVEPLKREITVPLIKAAEEGMTLESLAVCMERDLIALDFSGTFSKVERPMATEYSEHGEVAKPKVTTRTCSSKIYLKDRSTLVLYMTPPASESGARKAFEKDCTAYFITVRKLTEGDLGSLENRDR